MAANEVILAHDFAAVEPDVVDVAELGNLPAADEAAEIMSDGRAPPTGWRRDDFPPNGPVRRTVWAPPWSLRPPNLEPEEWLSQNQKHKDFFMRRVEVTRSCRLRKTGRAPKILQGDEEDG